MSEAFTLEQATEDFISSLDFSGKLQVKGLVLNTQVKPSLVWYQKVVDRYLSGPHSARLMNDIRIKYPNEAVWRELDSPAGVPMFEAGTILRSAQARLN